jgi:hypothetical protein
MATATKVRHTPEDLLQDHQPTDAETRRGSAHGARDGAQMADAVIATLPWILDRYAKEHQPGLVSSLLGRNPRLSAPSVRL